MQRNLQVFMQMGTPRVLISDRGTEFHNQFNEGLIILLKVDHRSTTAYHITLQDRSQTNTVPLS